jgi:hypothetical protein
LRAQSCHSALSLTGNQQDRAADQARQTAATGSSDIPRGKLLARDVRAANDGGDFCALELGWMGDDRRKTGSVWWEPLTMHRRLSGGTFVPLAFRAGEAFQFDWSGVRSD